MDSHTEIYLLEANGKGSAARYALRTTPTAPLELVPQLPPIALFAKKCAAKSAERLLGNDDLATADYMSLGASYFTSPGYLLFLQTGKVYNIPRHPTQLFPTINQLLMNYCL